MTAVAEEATANYVAAAAAISRRGAVLAFTGRRGGVVGRMSEMMYTRAD